MKKFFAIVVTTAVLMAGGVTAASAAPVSSESSIVLKPSSSKTGPLTDESVIEFFASSRGPIAESHPELTRYIPETATALTHGQIKVVVTAYREAASKSPRSESGALG